MATRIPKKFQNMSASSLKPITDDDSTSESSSPVPRGTKSELIRLAAIELNKSEEKILEDIEYCWLLDCTKDELLLYCNITSEEYRTLLENHPQVKDREKALRSHPELLARQNLVEAIKAGDLDTSKWYLERKRPEEFVKPSKIDSTTTITQNIQLPVEDRQRAIAEFLATLDVADAMTVSDMSDVPHTSDMSHMSETSDILDKSNMSDISDISDTSDMPDQEDDNVSTE